MLRLYLLGGFRAEFDSHPFAVPYPSGLTGLWGFLLLHARRPVDRTQLAFKLWPEVSEAEARALLRRYLHQLRQLLRSASPQIPWLLEKGHTLGWNTEADYWLDVDQFSICSTASAPDQIAAGLALYHGDLLPELADDWLVPHRSWLRADYLFALNRLIEIQTASGDYLAAETHAATLLRADPHSEATQRTLMRLRYLSGDRSGALRHFNEYLTSRPHVGSVDPLAPETLALREAIASGVDLPAVPSARALPVQEASHYQPAFNAQTTWSAQHSEIKPGVHHRTPWDKLRWLILIPLTFLVALGLFTSLWIFRPLSPLETLVLTGSPVVQDTWIISAIPAQPSAGDLDQPWLYVNLHDGRGLINPRVPFAQYPALRLNLANKTVSDALLHFDLDQLPAGSFIVNARLTVYLEPDVTWASKSRLPPVTIAAYRLLRGWDVTTATFNEPWTEPGLKPGSDYDPTPLSQETVLTGGTLTINLKAALPAWRSGNNFGIILRVTEAPGGESPYWMATTEHSAPALRPRLVIEYR